MTKFVDNLFVAALIQYFVIRQACTCILAHIYRKIHASNYLYAASAFPFSEVLLYVSKSSWGMRFLRCPEVRVCP